MSLFSQDLLAQACCVGSTYDLAVLSLNKRVLFGAGYNYDNYLGVWDQEGSWKKNNNTSWQMRPSFNSAYRFNKHIQASISVPFVFNRNELPGLNPSGSGIGDITVGGRYEFMHEFQLIEDEKKIEVDRKTPYLAATFGLVFPTGRSDEDASGEYSITGKGYYSTLLGVSFLKTLPGDKFQLGADVSWQHNFRKTYEKYFGSELQTPYTKTVGDRFNYSISASYLISNYHAASLSAGGFYQGAYKINNNEGTDSDEHGFNFNLSYSYFPVIQFRITPSVRWILPLDNAGKNAPGSLAFGINLIYYIEDYDIE